MHILSSKEEAMRCLQICYVDKIWIVVFFLFSFILIDSLFFMMRDEVMVTVSRYIVRRASLVCRNSLYGGWF